MSITFTIAPPTSQTERALREFQEFPAKDPEVAAWLDEHRPDWRQMDDMDALAHAIADAVIGLHDP